MTDRLTPRSDSVRRIGDNTNMEGNVGEDGSPKMVGEPSEGHQRS